MKQNKYDDPDFFQRYSQMPRSVDGLHAAGEWSVFRSLLPVLADKNVLDLGCGFGWHCRYAREQGARYVVGVDLSANMLARARSTTNDPAIEYRQTAIEDIDFAPGSFDVVISSLALHYVEQLETVYRKVYDCLTPGGAFVFSAEHPVFTAIATQDWYYDAAGNRLHWPVDHYQAEGIRQTHFLDNAVVKYHRTLATHINALVAAGFRITGAAEPKPSDEVLAAYPEMKDEVRRPIFLLLAAVKPGSK
ncbi:class I SAM-dependent methyltransferase [Chitinophaga nivalis]|uniref:Class I SAM-dependent methyltransferase n=1 Tax=Chitinophaga nivalis TaxID=2991709 RepID=A0ABT3IMM9_9BACT|nr:class I SAM-dependent methyltransferase [Chitinophaga nivalis]MCW3465083.1 class I SAM-dependent methyltransferase [Chitinophaga nivalis]MCW3485225.1 class I SAM-dependent methyltransferase [Chitinophaga nivalis]